MHKNWVNTYKKGLMPYKNMSPERRVHDSTSKLYAEKVRKLGGKKCTTQKRKNNNNGLWTRAYGIMGDPRVEIDV